MSPCLLETTGQSWSCFSFPRFLNKIVSKQLLTVQETNSILKEFPCFFGKFHGTGTALLKPINNLLTAGMRSVLVQLDLTAAFDTIDHRISMDGLRWRFWVQLKIYLMCPWKVLCICEKICHCASYLKYGVPQGSV